MTLDWAAPAEPDGDVIVQIAMLGVSNTILVDDVTCCPLAGGDR